MNPVGRRIAKVVAKLGGTASFEELRKEGLVPPEIERGAAVLEQEGLAKISRERVEEVSLNRRGLAVRKHGLPERQLYALIERNSMALQELKKTVGPDILAAGLGILKRTGAVRIDEGKLIPLKKPAFSLEKSIEKVEKGGSLTESELTQLKKRGCIELKYRQKGTITLGKDWKEAGKDDITNLSSELLTSGKWKNGKLLPYDITIPVKTIRPAKLHPYREYLNKIRALMTNMGFQEVETPYVELEFWNFDALFQPQDHPARELHDVFRIETPASGTLPKKPFVSNVKKTHENGWTTGSMGWRSPWTEEKAKLLILRSQNTAASVRTLAHNPNVPGKYFTLDRVFRRDEIDQKHFIEFYQLDGIVIGEELNVSHLMGYLESLGKTISGAREVRFRPSYFPFTEPSLEIDVKHPDMGWIEVGGSGILRPEVTKPLGVDADVLAWGLGIDRLVMSKKGITDIRELVFPHDIEHLARAVIE